MKRDFLKELGIEDNDTIDKIIDQVQKELQVERDKTDAVTKERDNYKSQAESINAEETEKLKKQLADSKAQTEEWEKKYSNMEKDTALEKAVQETGTIDSQVLINLIDKDKLTFEEDGIKGLDEQIKSLKESKSYLFKKQNEDNRFDSHIPPAGDDPSKTAMQTEIESIFNN